jgi:PKD repeat protein
MKKKILLSLICAVTGMVSFAQNFTITGTITDANANPVPNHEVYISGDSVVFNYYNTVVTDANGNYTDVITNGAQVGPNIDFYIATYDYCTPSGGWQSAVLSNNQGTVTSGVADFVICDSAASNYNCYASFYGYDSSNTGDYYFIDMSYGSGLTYAWDFGDGNTSSQQFPSHTFALGTYSVCLTVTGASCTDTYCQTITVGGPACNAYFYSYVDSLNSTLYVVNLSNNTSGTLTYAWDFGDGNTSNLQYPSHTYANVGMYTVCLTVADMFCTSTYCDTIGITQFMVDGSRSGFTLNVIAPSALGLEEEVNTITEFTAYPNPATENVSLEYNSLSAGNHSITLNDVTGKLIYTENYSAQKGNNLKQINLNGIEAGIYLVTIATENGMLNHIRLIKN